VTLKLFFSSNNFVHQELLLLLIYFSLNIESEYDYFDYIQSFGSISRLKSVRFFLRRDTTGKNTVVVFLFVCLFVLFFVHLYFEVWGFSHDFS